jgi:hypothetical protein
MVGEWEEWWDDWAKGKESKINTRHVVFQT